MGTCWKMFTNKRTVDELAIPGLHPFVIVTVRPIVNRARDSMQYWICMNVPTEVQQVRLAVDEFAFGRTFKNRATVGIFFIVGFAVNVEDALREERRTGKPILSDENMIMIGEKDVGDDGD